MRTRIRLAPLLALSAALSCGDASTAPDAVPTELPRASVIISNPIGNATANAATGQANGMVYVSMPPGTVAAGEHVHITNVSTGATTGTALIDGGFDPVALSASVGHTLIVSILHNAVVTVRSAFIVQPGGPPAVVRTSPAAKKLDVPLNVVIVLVFSEPIDTLTVDTLSVRLAAGTAPVRGRFEFGETLGTLVTFVPHQPLASGTDYRLTIDSAVADLDGETMRRDVIVDFSTIVASDVASGLVLQKDPLASGDEQTDTILATLPDPLRVRVLRNGSPAAGVAVVWELVTEPYPYSPETEPLVTPNSTLTDDAGIAAATITLGQRSRQLEIRATIPGVDGASTGFIAFTNPGTPVRVRVMDNCGAWDSVLCGPDQYGIPDEPLRNDYIVVTEDRFGNPAPGGDIVEWLVTSGGGTLATGSFAGCYDMECYVGPHLASASHVLGTSYGAQTVMARLPEALGASHVTFAANAVGAAIGVGRYGEHGQCLSGFEPAAVTVSAGAPVAWVWNSCHENGTYPAHDVTFESGATSEGDRERGSIQRTFSTPGTYRFRCTRHSTSFTEGEVGTVIVQ